MVRHLRDAAHPRCPAGNEHFINVARAEVRSDAKVVHIPLRGAKAGVRDIDRAVRTADVRRQGRTLLNRAAGHPETNLVKADIAR